MIKLIKDMLFHARRRRAEARYLDARSRYLDAAQRHAKRADLWRQYRMAVAELIND